MGETEMLKFAIVIGLQLIGGQWAQNGGELGDWFKSLHNRNGFPCCDYLDGHRVEDPDYKENDDGSYEVLDKGEWLHVDKEHLVDGTNRIGYAILWKNPSLPNVYCFMPGARG